MASYFNLTLDTTAPSGGSITLASLTNTRTITATISATGATQMKIYGDVGTGSTATAEASASWETYAESKSIQLTSGDGAKTVKIKFRDSVGNESAEASATVSLDTTAAVVTITGPDVSTISKVDGYDEAAFSFSADGYDEAAFSFSADGAFVEYKVCVVTSASSLHSAGTVIGTTNGSTNMSATGTFAASTAISCTINGADLEAASSGDGAKIIKVFVKDSAGNWSV